MNLELSLSKVLVQFYPLCGRCVVEDCYIDCSDEGVEFVEAKAPTVELTDLIGKRDFGNLVGLFPHKNHQTDELTYPLFVLLNIQGISNFTASSLGTFIVAWSNASKSYPCVDTYAISPILDVFSSIFPKSWENVDPDKLREPEVVSFDTYRAPIKRFTFYKQAIERVRSGLRPRQGDKGWSKVLEVSFVITKALMGVERRKRGGATRSFFVNHVVNLRERTVPPLPKHACGNFSFMGRNKCMNDMGIQELVDIMREGMNETLATCAEMLPLDKDGLIKCIMEPFLKELNAIKCGESIILVFSDFSRFGFYKADFGWGKPASASINHPMAIENSVVLVGNKEGNGIDAWVYLEKNEMALFEQDVEIKLLATYKCKSSL